MGPLAYRVSPPREGGVLLVGLGDVRADDQDRHRRVMQDRAGHAADEPPVDRTESPSPEDYHLSAERLGLLEDRVGDITWVAVHGRHAASG